MNVTDGPTSAFYSGLQGYQRASDNISQAASSIAGQTADRRSVQEVLSDTAAQQIGLTGDILQNVGADNLTSDLVSLSVNQINAQANLKVVGTANDTLGRIIDELA